MDVPKVRMHALHRRLHLFGMAHVGAQPDGCSAGMLNLELCQLVIDIGHSTRAGADHAAFIRRYHPRIRAFHLKDWNSAGQTRLGEGKVNLPAFAQVIRETLWSGWLTAELEGVLPLGLTAHENALHARRYIREKMEP